MFKLNLQHSRGLQNSTFPYKTACPRQDGYNNIESPMKAAFLHQVSSPHKNLSPMKLKSQQRMNLSRSPNLPNKREDGYFSGAKMVSPFGKRAEMRQLNDEGYNAQKNISFTNLIRKSSNPCNSPHGGQYSVQPLQPSTAQNYLPSDRNVREDTNLFKKLASMLESNNKSNKSFVNSGISQNSVHQRQMPQSCKNGSHEGSNKKVMFKNVLTIESIQSPQDLRYDGKECIDGIETRCYLEYERSNKELPPMQKKQSSKKDRNEPVMQKKLSSVREDQALSFKRIPFSNQKKMEEHQQSRPIDFHLTNSFGAVALKSQLTVQASVKKQLINPFQQIQKPIQDSSSLHSITKSLQGESVFASLQMLLEKVDDNDKQQPAQKYNESINISIASDSSGEQLDMEPFIDR